MTVPKLFTHPTREKLTGIAQDHYRWDAEKVGKKLDFCAAEVVREFLKAGDYIAVSGDQAEGWAMVTHFNQDGFSEVFCVQLKVTPEGPKWHHFFIMVGKCDTVKCLDSCVVSSLMETEPGEGPLTAVELPARITVSAIGREPCSGYLHQSCM